MNTTNDNTRNKSLNRKVKEKSCFIFLKEK